MPVKLDPPEGILPVAGVRLAAVAAGLRKSGEPDVVVIELAPDSRLAASFTRNRFCAAPVTVAKEHLSATAPRFLLINAANANAGTGAAGLADARECCRRLAGIAAEKGVAEVTEQAVVPFSTGVIGQRLPVEKIAQSLPQAVEWLADPTWTEAARAIMTTDTVPKAVSRRVDTDVGSFTVTGMAKGAGMICPDMATMLAFVATDASIPQAELSELHRRLVERTFNRISVDGDTSTNDAGVLIVTGRGPVLEAGSDAYKRLETALSEVYGVLARAIVRDAEGATKFVTVTVSGGVSDGDCERIARTVAHSPLVKTALYASDANWGRILAAVGRAGVDIDIGRVGLAINGVTVLTGGEPDDAYSEAAGGAAMAAEEIEIGISLGLGSAGYTLWTSDLSHEYVRINAEYRT